MIERLWKVAFCAFVALAIGMAMAAAIHAAGSPGTWSHPEWLWATAQAGGLFYVAVPLAALALATFFGRPPSTGFCLFVALAWFTMIFVWWAKKPWVYYGDFPWQGFKRHYLGMLPLPLSFGLAFAVCTRNVLGPNNSFKPKPLRGSA